MMNDKNRLKHKPALTTEDFFLDVVVVELLIGTIDRI